MNAITIFMWFIKLVDIGSLGKSEQWQHCKQLLKVGEG